MSLLAPLALALSLSASADESPAFEVSLLAAAPGPATPGASACRDELFRIARNKNANEIVYRARQARPGALDREEPMEAYWLMLAEDGHREGMSFIERIMAYGFSAEPAQEGDGFTVSLKAKKDRPLHLAIREGCPVALARIGGSEGVLRRIYVHATGESLIPTVDYVELFGVDPATGRELYEKIGR
ncbi:MAG TPA: DUF4833 domain-containing protein [Anaeromyxobacteraceae bacterium]|nr:DUF4833 domain-containing protein [Anaeromyxobacteraceae bacterium]